MHYPEFLLETYLAKREFSAPYNLCASDIETHSLQELLAMADSETKRLWETLDLSYTEPKGHPLLRKEIGKEYGLGEENVLCFAGAEEGIFAAMEALLAKEDHAIAITPCYQSLKSLPGRICSVTEIPLSHQTKWQLDVEAVEKAIKPNTKMLVINFPHNPTGTLISLQEQNKLVDCARKHDLWIFSDEVYRLLEVDEKDRLPPIASAYEKGISLSVMSKAFGLPGLRVGWLCCQNTEALEEIGEIKHYLSICNSAPSEILSLIALRAKERILSRNKKLLDDNLALLDRFFEEYQEHFEWVRPKGGCTGYPLLKSEMGIQTFADRLMEEEGVLILPSTVYEEKTNHFRISFGRASMPEVLERFKNFADKTLT